MASVFAIPPSTTADAAATLCSNVYLVCFPPMDSSASLPNARYTHCHSLTVSRGTDRASAAGLQPTPASKSSTARLLDSRSCFTLRSILMENLPFPDVQEMGGSSLSPMWWVWNMWTKQLRNTRFVCRVLKNASTCIVIKTKHLLVGLCETLLQHCDMIHT